MSTFAIPSSGTLSSSLPKRDTSSNTSHPTSQHHSFRSLRKAIGTSGSVIAIGGTVTILGVLGFLIFLWTGEGSDEGRSAVATWRFIILGEWITQAITLATVALQVTTTAQASVCTGLVAAMVLERKGVRMSQVVEYSLIRSNNDGPLRLSWLLASSLRRSLAVQTLLAILLLLAAVAGQFASTILVSDLSNSSIVANPRKISTGVSATASTRQQFHLSQAYVLKPSFQAFGEVSGTDPTPQNGVSDTGVVRRIHPLVPQANRTSLRQYDGKGFVLNSRVVCLAPSIEDLVLRATDYHNPSFELYMIPTLYGRISYNQTFHEAGLSYPPGFENGSYFPSSFGCNLAMRINFNGTDAVSGCIPSGSNAHLPSYNSTISNTPVANTSEVFLFTRSTLNLNTTFGDTNITSLVSAVKDDEWIKYTFENGASLEVSLCFQQLHYDHATVYLTSDTDLADASVFWDANSTLWDTTSVRRFFGTANETISNDTASRGLFSVGGIMNSTRSYTTSYLTNVQINDNYESYETPNVSMNLSPYGGGAMSILPHVDYQAIFSDTLDQTNRPAVALQSMTTAMSGTIIDGLLTQFDTMENITEVFAVSVQVPRRFLGLGFVLGISVVHLVNVVLIVFLYLTQTEHTSAGNYWHAIAQIVSNITQPILHLATRATDDEVAEMLHEFDIKVKLERSSDRGGRVQVVPCEKTV